MVDVIGRSSDNDLVKVFEIGRPIGVDHPPFIVAALDGRRLGTYERAAAAIDAAANSRCDAVKLTAMPWG